MKKNSYIIVFLLGILLCGCGRYSLSKGQDTKTLETTLAQLNVSDPSEDARRNADDGDFRFAACLGEAPGQYFPSVPRNDWDGIWSEKDYWMIDGTSDAIESDYHMRLIERAVEYAEGYNEAIVNLRPKQ